MPEEESNFRALAVFTLAINQLRRHRRAGKWQRQ
jgi:hypothetical protein